MTGTWLDTPAGRFHAASGAADLPTPQDFARAEFEETRVAARREFDMAHRPNDPPTVPITAMEAERAFAIRRDQIAMRANWVGTGTPDGDAEIRERCRRMAAGVEAERIAALARVTGPGEMSPAQIEAQSRMDRATRGVPVPAGKPARGMLPDAIEYGDFRCWDDRSGNGREESTVTVQTELRFGYRVVHAFTETSDLIVLDASGARGLAAALASAADSLNGARHE